MQEIKDMVCPFCGCLCDDVTLEVENGKILSTDNCCTIGNAKFMGKNRLKNPIKKVDGAWVDITWDEAVTTAVDMLLDADRPLLYGWSGTHGDGSFELHFGELGAEFTIAGTYGLCKLSGSGQRSGSYDVPCPSGTLSGQQTLTWTFVDLPRAE